MRHKIAGKKLGMTSAHRVSLIRNLATCLITHDQIKTTLVKAKLLRPHVEKMITKVKRHALGDKKICLSSLRLNLHSEDALKRLAQVVAPRYKSRQGGYTRIIKEGYRQGDMAPMAYIELVDWNKN